MQKKTLVYTYELLCSASLVVYKSIRWSKNLGLHVTQKIAKWGYNLWRLRIAILKSPVHRFTFVIMLTVICQSIPQICHTEGMGWLAEVTGSFYNEIKEHPATYPELTKQLFIWEQMNGEIDPNSSTEQNPPIVENLTANTTNSHTNSTATTTNAENILQEFITDIHSLTKALESHLIRAGNHTGLIVQAGQRALDQIYPGMSQVDVSALLDNLDGLDLSQFGSKETIAHLITTLNIKAKVAHTAPEVIMNIYPKAYEVTLAKITGVFYQS